VREARYDNDIVIVSIFINPTQFGPNEDLSRYPHDLKRDVGLVKELGVDIVFAPTAKEMYPEGFQTFVEPTGPLTEEVEGAIRPGHFRGMATIVLKLFNIVKPTNTYFGQKDAQQALIVAKMIQDLNLQINIHVLPTVREHDGLAMSSRNVNLAPAERKAAPILYQALTKAKAHFTTNPGQNSDILKNIITETIKKEPLMKLAYIEIRHPGSFEELKTLQTPALILIAAKIGTTRLIDNFLLSKD
jgi:pantoate--beta-alanine ligase